MNIFETELGASLRQAPGLFVYRFPDGMANWRPGDWIVASGTRVNGPYTAIIEAKMVTRTGPWNIRGGWTDQQRAVCNDCITKGIRYILVINWRVEARSKGVAVAYDGGDLLHYMQEGLASLRHPPDARGTQVHWSTIDKRWDVERFL